MPKTDHLVNIILIIAIIIHFSILVSGSILNKMPLFTTATNLLFGITILIYWVQKQLSITQHNYDLPEVSVLCFELVVISFAAYSILKPEWNTILKTLQYIVFGIHLIALILFLIFMLTFKITKLM